MATAYQYNALGQQTQESDYANGTLTGTTTTTYDLVTGNVASVTSPEGTVNYEFDPVTGLETETWTGTNSASPTTEILYGYTQQGQLASVTEAKIDGDTPTA